MLYVNTLVGDFSKPRPSTISVRTVELMTLTKAMDEALEEGDLDSVREIYRRYKADPVRGRENTVGEMITYGYGFLNRRQVAEALLIFGLNAESYPRSAAAQYQLGEANRYVGRTKQAIAQYRKTLALDPDHANAKSRLAQLASQN